MTVCDSNMCPCFLEPRENSPEMNEMKKVNKDLQVCCQSSCQFIDNWLDEFALYYLACQ